MVCLQRHLDIEALPKQKMMQVTRNYPQYEGVGMVQFVEVGRLCFHVTSSVSSFRRSGVDR